jgi:coenzyme F420-reducing hydrogenase alpha subunit
MEEVNKLMKKLLKNYNPEEESVAQKYGVIASANPLGKEVTGIDAIEAPRGTLYHHYSIDKNGYITDCSIITPTVCYLRNIEADVAEYIPNLNKLSDKQRSIKIRALIRAYDPCIACATH